MSDLDFVLACFRFAWLYITRDPVYLANAPQSVTNTSILVSGVVTVFVVGVVGFVVLVIIPEVRETNRRHRERARG